MVVVTRCLVGSPAIRVRNTALHSTSLGKGVLSLEVLQAERAKISAILTDVSFRTLTPTQRSDVQLIRRDLLTAQTVEELSDIRAKTHNLFLSVCF